MAGDPADIGHAPVHVFRMNILDEFRCTRHISQITTRTVLTAFRTPGSAAGVHEEERVLRWNRNRFHYLATIFLEDLVDEEVSSLNHRFGRMIFSCLTAPHQDFFNLLAFFC